MLTIPSFAAMDTVQVQVPLRIYQELLKAQYYKQAMEASGVQKWEGYKDAQLLMVQLATDNIIDENQDAE